MLPTVRPADLMPRRSRGFALVNLALGVPRLSPSLSFVFRLANECLALNNVTTQEGTRTGSTEHAGDCSNDRYSSAELYPKVILQAGASCMLRRGCVLMPVRELHNLLRLLSG